LDFALNERDLSPLVPDVCATFHRNSLKIATVRERTHMGQSDTQSENIISAFVNLA